MSETVFILGAGASKEADAPLMNEFLDEAEKLMKEKGVGDAEEDFDLVFRGIDALQRADSKAHLDSVNLETVFGAFEMVKLTRRLDPLTANEIGRLPRAMKRVIEITLEMKIVFRPVGDRVIPPTPYDIFVDLVNDIVSSPGNSYQSVSIITFNYDVCLDYAFHHRNIQIDYCLGEGTEASGLKVLKLHGSLNWILCPDCEQVVPWHMRDYFQQFEWSPLLAGHETEKRLDIASKLINFRHCGNTRADESMIIPPTVNKMQHHDKLQTVWQAAGAELENAENIFISGYSLPNADQFFPYLYAIGTIGRARLKRIWVFDPYPTEALKSRFTNILGPAAISRFLPVKTSFSGAIKYIRDNSDLIRN